MNDAELVMQQVDRLRLASEAIGRWEGWRLVHGYLAKEDIEQCENARRDAREAHAEIRRLLQGPDA
jgi:hypothetical protein